MKPLSTLTKEDIKDLKLVVFDVDGVTIKKGTDIQEIKTVENTTLTVKTSNLSLDMRDALLLLKKKYFIAICSGRSSMYLTKVFNELLWNNCALISEIGIFTLINGELIQNKKFEQNTLNKMINIKKDLANLEGKARDFRAFEPKQFLITLHAHADMPEVYEVMKKHDPEGEFYTLWNGEAFDIAPKVLDKGTGIKSLSTTLGIDISQVIAIGNGPNDKSMTDAAGIGITTDKKSLQSDYYTEGNEELGGFEIIEKLLELTK
jgi:HAD superfamily hydrolase (TIGR01484 family)